MLRWGLFQSAAKDLPVIKSPRDISLMREAGRLVAGAFKIVEDIVGPGITTGEIDSKITEFVKSKNGEMAFKGYQGFQNAVRADCQGTGAGSGDQEHAPATLEILEKRRQECP